MPTLPPSSADRAATRRLPSAVDWAAIIAGGVLAIAISFILLTFGSAIGLSLTSPYEGEGRSLAFLGVASGLWVVWVQISSFIAGAYLAGRLRRRLPDATAHEVEVRDGSHGLLVWALGSPRRCHLRGLGGDGCGEHGRRLWSRRRRRPSAPVSRRLLPRTQPLWPIRSIRCFAPAIRKSPRMPPTARPKPARILARSAAQGSISADDKSYLAQLIQARTGLAQPEAEQRIDQVMASIAERRRRGEGSRRQGAPGNGARGLRHCCLAGGERRRRLVGGRHGWPPSRRGHRLQSSCPLALRAGRNGCRSGLAVG